MQVKSISDERLDELGEEFTRRLRQGARPSFAEFTTGYGVEQAAEIEAFLESVALLEELKQASDSDVADAQKLPPLFGRYKVGRTLGMGGMGAVYLAVDSQLEREVALKTPRMSRCSSPGFVERFYREAKSAATLRHPNICPVYDVGQIEGIHYLSMAYIPGRSLAELLEEEESISVDTAVQIVVRVAGALHEAHRQGVIHRDLKPANIMIDQQGEPVVTDFGLARPVAGAEQEELPEAEPTDQVANSDTSGQKGQLTQAGAILGSPGYMAPEQIRGDGAATGVGTDIFALGVVLYEMLAGVLPDRKNGEVTLDSHRATRKVPRNLLSVCRKAMAPEVQSRFASMDEFVAALSSFTGNTQTKRNAAKPRRLMRVAVWAAMVLVGVLLLGAVGGLIFRPGPSDARLPDSPSANPADAFMVFDADQDGAVSEAELNAADTRMHPPDSPLRRAISNFKQFDSSSDGKLQPIELQRIMLPGRGAARRPEHRGGPPRRGRGGERQRLQP